MKFALIIVVCMCLAQNTAHGHAIAKRATSPTQAAINTAIAQFGSAATQVSSAIVEANRLLHVYSDNSTDYASYFRIDILAEINAALALVDKAFANATATAANASRGDVTACFKAEQNRTREMAVNLAEEVVKCGITKVRQFVDLALNLATLANTTVFLVPLTNQRIQNCSQEPNPLFMVGCIGWQTGSALAKLAQISLGVSLTVATASTLYGTIQADLVLCAQAKLFSFRRRIVEIPLTIGLCAGKTVIG